MDPLVQIARRRSLVVIVLAAALLALLIYALQRIPSVVDLGAYPDTGTQLPEFVEEKVTNEPRLEGFRQVQKYSRGVLQQMIYDRPDGLRVVLLSAPAHTSFRFSADRRVNGIHAFLAGGRNYVLICKACTPATASGIMRQLGV